ncbi:MAG: hypothetical protein KC613_08240, partial [Myxococcales bacterium]|nr:hypothetical protein [Myxococcales bacterium]
MRPRLIILLVVLVLAPLAVLGWLGQRVAADQRAAVVARFDAVVRARLGDTAEGVGRVLGERARTLRAALAEPPVGVEPLRAWLGRQTDFAHMLVLDAERQVIFPPLTGPRSEAEGMFLERTRGLWEGKALAAAPSKSGPPQGTAPGVDRNAPQAPSEDGWHIWYWGGGLNLMFWRRLADGRLLAVELDRVALLADVVAALPTTGGGGGAATRLLDSAGRTVYQWGDGEVPEGATPTHSQALPAPLGAWHLARFGPTAPPQPTAPGLWIGLGAGALALIGLAAWFVRESTRELRLARQRVTFVNQVSHELKTPLTN